MEMWWVCKGMNRVILLVGNQMGVIGHLSPEIITNPTRTALERNTYAEDIG